MLGLQVAAPVYRVLKLVLVLLQQLDSLGVGQADKVGVDDVLQALDQALVDKLVEEGHLLRAALHDIGQDILHHVLGQIHHVGQVREGDLRLHHPELRSVAGGVGFFSAEGRAKGIDVGEGHRHALALQLAGDGQAGRLAEEVLAEIDLAVLGAGRVLHIQGGDAEHFAGALAVTSGDQRGVDVDKAALIKEFVDGESRFGTDTEHRAEGVGSGAQVCDGAQKFHRVALFLQRIIGCGVAFHLDGGCVDFIRLLGLWGQDERSGDNNGSADVEFPDLIEIVHLAFFEHYLQILKASTVVQFNKAQAFGCANGSDPSGYSQLLIRVLLGAGCELSQFYSLHRFYLHHYRFSLPPIFLAKGYCGFCLAI